MIPTDKLKAYCKEKEIFVPAGANRAYLEAAIVRTAIHGAKVELSESECYGFWERENTTCMVCDFQKGCQETSLGIPLATLEKKLERAESPRLRFHRLGKSSKMKL